MAPIQSRVRKPRDRNQTYIPIPHSSWSRADRPDRPPVAIAPDDFWARLGL